MAKRPDVDVVALAVSKKRMSAKEASDWIKLPFIDLPKRGTPTGVEFLAYYDRVATEQTKQHAAGNLRADVIRDLFRKEGRIFHSFIVQTTVVGDFMRVDINDDETIDFTPLSNDTSMWFINQPMMRTRVYPQPDAFDLGIVMGFSLIGEAKRWLEKKIPDPVANRQTVQNVAHECFKGYLEFVRFCDYNEENDKYAIGVREQGKQKGSSIGSFSSHLKSKQGPSVIYLDKLPSAGGEATGAGAEKRPHQRRGTWVTLRSERYRYHPKYQVEKGVYRKPAWVGPREAIVEGNIYTILE